MRRERIFCKWLEIAQLASELAVSMLACHLTGLLGLILTCHFLLWPGLHTTQSNQSSQSKKSWVKIFVKEIFARCFTLAPWLKGLNEWKIAETTALFIKHTRQEGFDRTEPQKTAEGKLWLNVASCAPSRPPYQKKRFFQTRHGIKTHHPSFLRLKNCQSQK